MSTLTKGRLTWLVLSFVAMLVAACAVVDWLVDADAVSNWIGLPQYEGQIPGLRLQAEVCLMLAVTLPFLAALFLWLGRRKPEEYSSLFEYGIRLGISILGTIVLTLCIFLFDWLLLKIDLHINHD